MSFYNLFNIKQLHTRKFQYAIVSDSATFEGQATVTTSTGNQITLRGEFTIEGSNESVNHEVFLEILKHLVHNNSKIDAIRSYRQATNCSLLDAKLYVESVIKILEKE